MPTWERSCSSQISTNRRIHNKVTKISTNDALLIPNHAAHFVNQSPEVLPKKESAPPCEPDERQEHAQHDEHVDGGYQLEIRGQ